MIYRLTVPSGGDLYEVLVRDETIVRIHKFLGESQMMREVSFDDLPTFVQDDLLVAIAARNDDNE